MRGNRQEGSAIKQIHAANFDCISFSPGSYILVVYDILRVYTLLLYSIYAQAARLPIYVQPLQKWSTLKGPYRIKGKNSFNALLLIAKKLAVLLLKLISLTGTLGRILFHYLAISLSHEYIVSNWFLVVVAFHAYIQSPAYYLYIIF